MLNQKYSEIIGFFLIIFGSIIQFVVAYLGVSCYLTITKQYALQWIIIGTIILNVLFVKIIKQIVIRQHDRISINDLISRYEELSQNKNKVV